MFIFAIYGVQIIGGQLARCNDRQFYEIQVSEQEEEETRLAIVITCS